MVKKLLSLLILSLGIAGCTAFTARPVDLEPGVVVWSVSANRSLTIKNAAFAAHAASQDALSELQAKLNK